MAINLIIELSEKDSKYVASQIEVSDVDIQTIRRIFSVGEDDPLMYNSYKIDENINEILYSYIGIKLNIQKYDCYAGYRACS